MFLFLGFLIGLIGSLFVKVGEIIYDVMRAIGPWVQTLVGTVRSVVDTIARHAGDFFRFIANGARGIFSNVLVPVARALQSWFQKFRDFLHRVFDPILRIVDKINGWLDTVWRKVISPIIDVIDKLRAIFSLLDQLGVSWAGAISNFLRTLETRIYDSFREVRSFVNTFSSWIDLLLDPRGWIRSTPFLWTIYQFSGNVFNLLTKLGVDELTPARLELTKQALAPTAIDSTVAAFRDGTIRNSFAVTQARARFNSSQSGTIDNG